MSTGPTDTTTPDLTADVAVLRERLFAAVGRVSARTADDALAAALQRAEAAEAEVARVTAELDAAVARAACLEAALAAAREALLGLRAEVDVWTPPPPPSAP